MRSPRGNALKIVSRQTEKRIIPSLRIGYPPEEIIHPKSEVSQGRRSAGADTPNGGYSAPTTDTASEIVLVVVLVLETTDDEGESEDEGSAGIPC
jgi:hypothetical protein